MPGSSEVRNHIVIAGHKGDAEPARANIAHPDATVRIAALNALARTCELTTIELDNALDDPAPSVRRCGLKHSINHRDVQIVRLLSDSDATVVEVAAWACGEREIVPVEVIAQLEVVARTHEDALCRESAVAALGAIGHAGSIDTVLHAMADKATVRRRAVLALAAFDGAAAATALRDALHDRDWQVRQGAEDILDAISDADPFDAAASTELEPTDE